MRGESAGVVLRVRVLFGHDFFFFFSSHYCFCRLPHWPTSSTTTSLTTPTGVTQEGGVGPPPAVHAYDFLSRVTRRLSMSFACDTLPLSYCQVLRLSLLISSHLIFSRLGASFLVWCCDVCLPSSCLIFLYYYTAVDCCVRRLIMRCLLLHLVFAVSTYFYCLLFTPLLSRLGLFLNALFVPVPVPVLFPPPRRETPRRPG